VKMALLSRTALTDFHGGGDTQRVPETVTRRISAGLFAAVCACLLVKAALVFIQNINWDEYYFLSLVHDFQRGELTKALQTFHVYPFYWLTWLARDEIMQVELGRLTMWVFFASTCFLTYFYVRAFASQSSAIFAALFLVSAPDAIMHGASFRADPLAASLIMAAIAIWAKSPLSFRWSATAGIAIALAALVTVKVVFFAPAFAALAYWRWTNTNGKSYILHSVVTTALLGACTFGAAYLSHEQMLPDARLDASAKMLGSAAQTTLFGGDFEAVKFLSRQIFVAPVHSILMILAIGTALFFALSRSAKKEHTPLWLLFALASPLVSLLFYRNAFPYFYPFILPPTMVIVAWWIDRIKISPQLLALISAGLIVTGPVVVLAGYTHRQERQQQVLDNVHTIFAEPVRYIDRNSMIATFPKRGIFMSTWGLKKYAEAGRPIYGAILASEVVPLLLLNSPTLEDAMGQPVNGKLVTRLLPEDRHILGTNYVQHAGQIWVAGKTLSVGPVAQIVQFAIPGEYTLEALGNLTVNGKIVQPGAQLIVTRDAHMVSSDTTQTITLRWGNRLARPNAPKVTQGLFEKF
jgi:hypothetical protein